jgi:hypothetical protein
MGAISFTEIEDAREHFGRSEMRVFDMANSGATAGTCTTGLSHVYAAWLNNATAAVAPIIVKQAGAVGGAVSVTVASGNVGVLTVIGKR